MFQVCHKGWHWKFVVKSCVRAFKELYGETSFKIQSKMFEDVCDTLRFWH